MLDETVRASLIAHKKLLQERFLQFNWVLQYSSKRHSLWIHGESELHFSAPAHSHDGGVDFRLSVWNSSGAYTWDPIWAKKFFFYSYTNETIHYYKDFDEWNAATKALIAHLDPRCETSHKQR